MFTHVLCQNTKANTGEVVDREPRVAWVVHREETLETGPQNLVCHVLAQLRQSKVLSEILEEDLNEDAAARCRFFFVHVDDGHDVPAKGIGAEQVAKEASNVAKPVRFVSVDGVVVFGKRSLKQVRPETVDLGKSLSNKTVELGVCALLRATLDDHRWKLWLQARG